MSAVGVARSKGSCAEWRTPGRFADLQPLTKPLSRTEATATEADVDMGAAKRLFLDTCDLGAEQWKGGSHPAPRAKLAPY